MTVWFFYYQKELAESAYQGGYVNLPRGLRIMKPIKNELMLFPLDAIEFPYLPHTLRYSKLLHNYMHVTNTLRGRVWAGRFGQWADNPLSRPPMDISGLSKPAQWAALGSFGQSMHGLCRGLIRLQNLLIVEGRRGGISIL